MVVAAFHHRNPLSAVNLSQQLSEQRYSYSGLPRILEKQWLHNLVEELAFAWPSYQVP